MIGSRTLDVQGIGDSLSAIQDDVEIFDEEIFAHKPSYQNGSQTTVIGPPTSGAHVLNELWKDVNGAVYFCATAGTPGTWLQRYPAIINGEPGSGSYPTGYLMIDAGDGFAWKTHDGSLVWRKTFPAHVAAPASAGATGTVGQIAFDSSYAYFCVAANTWRRVAIATW